MGIPGLINAIGTGERISLSKLAVNHLERTARPIRVAVDISIWLFQVQAGRGGKNPELRTLFFRLLKLLSLPVHPLFVYDGQHKPPFKRGKAVSARSYGSAPIIRRSRDLIERFRFPWHEAPGEAEAECARLQRAGIVDAVMSNDVDALMFGSTVTIMNFSKESGTGTSASTHVTCYRMGNEGHVSNVPLNRAGMILFAMLSGGDYLPSGVPKCGSKLAAQIAKAQFGDDLLREISSESPDLDSRLNEWRERLQFELEENESGWFTTKHKAVRIPETFPDRVILKYYAEPIVSTEDEMAALGCRLRHAWDCEIDPSAIRSFAAEHFEWNYRSGARKVIKLLAEPLISYRLRLQRPIMGVQLGTLAPDCDTPWMQKVHKSRANFGTDGTTELQMDMLPIDVVGIDLLAEEPNPPLPSQENMPSQSTHQSGDEDNDPEVAAEAPPPTPSKSRVTKRYDPLAIEKVWIFETVARLGVPEIVKKWEDEQAAKAAKAAAPKPKKTTTRRTEPKKKGPIDPSMMRGSILKYGTLTKERSELSSSAKTQLLEAATSTKPAKDQRSSFQSMTLTDPDMDSSSPSMYSQHQASDQTPSKSHKMADLIGTFSSPSTVSTPTVKRHPMATQSRMRARAGILASTEGEIEEPTVPLVDTVTSPQTLPKGIKFSYSVSGDESSTTTAEVSKEDLATASLSFKKHRHVPKKPVKSPRPTGKSHVIEDFEEAVDSSSPSPKDEEEDTLQRSPVRSLLLPASSKTQELEARRSPSKTPRPKTPVSSVAPASSHVLPADVKGVENLPTQPSDQHLVPLIQSSSPPKDTSKKSKDKPRACTKAKDREPGPTPTAGHIENLTTSNGFWTVETLDRYEDDSTIPSTGRSATVNSAQQGQKKADRRKRVPRVSILDLL